MIIFPAIDIKDGKVVRLVKGEFDKITQYSDDPLAVAMDFKAKGAQWIHVIDLDGAKDGTARNFEIVSRIVKETHLPVQVGGGIRAEKDVQAFVSAGAKRLILGTVAVENPLFVKSLVAKYGDQAEIAVSLDCKDGLVAIKGWVETSEIKAVDFAKELQSYGVKTIIYTDIARDGMMMGPNFDALEELASAVNMNIIASGGISSLEDLLRIKDLAAQGIVGAIVGKSIYEGRIDLAEAIRVVRRAMR